MKRLFQLTDTGWEILRRTLWSLALALIILESVSAEYTSIVSIDGAARSINRIRPVPGPYAMGEMSVKDTVYILHRMRFNSHAHCLTFAPDGPYQLTYMSTRTCNDDRKGIYALSLGYVNVDNGGRRGIYTYLEC